MAEDPLSLALVALGIVVGAGATLYYITRRIRKRASRLHTDLAPSTRYRDDQAYNQVRLGRAEADILRRQGYDVSGPVARLDRADERLGRRDFEGASLLAGEAHEALVELRSAPAPALRAPAPERSVPLAAGVGVATGGAVPSPSATPATPKLEKNQAESRFQLTLLVEEFTRAKAAHPQDPSVIAAERSLGDAQLAFTRAEYTDALRIALKTRRSLGGQVEGLPAASHEALGGTSAAVPAGATGPVGPTCARCGRPVKAADKFCRACGAPRSGASCPRCGAPVTGDDVYCGACGAPMT